MPSLTQRGESKETTYRPDGNGVVKDGLSNGTDIGINTGIGEILKSALLDYNTGILGNWKIIGLDVEHIVTREGGEDRNSTKSQRGVNMVQEDRVLDWSVIGNKMRRLFGTE